MSQEPSYAQFLKDVSKHEVTILSDDGLYRHVKFKRPDSGCLRFDIITWPGYLAYTGDMGSYVFSRLDDMFKFFRKEEDRLDRVDFRYWAEKCEASDKNDGISEWDPSSFISMVQDKFEAFKEDSSLSEEELLNIKQDIDYDLLYGLEHEDVVLNRAYEYQSHGFTFDVEDLCGHKKYSQRFIWCCYALAWGINQYDKAKESK